MTLLLSQEIERRPLVGVEGKTLTPHQSVADRRLAHRAPPSVIQISYENDSRILSPCQQVANKDNWVMYANYCEGVGALIRRRREELGRTAADVAAAVGEKAAIVSQIETGRTKQPRADLRRRLAAEIGLHHFDLLVAAGEILPEELAPELVSARSGIGEEFARKVERLSADDRKALMQVLDRMLGETTRFSRPLAEAAEAPADAVAPGLS